MKYASKAEERRHAYLRERRTMCEGCGARIATYNFLCDECHDSMAIAMEHEYSPVLTDKDSEELELAEESSDDIL